MRYGQIPAGGHGPAMVQPNDEDAEKIVTPNSVQLRLAEMPKPYWQFETSGVRLTPATPMIDAVHDAHKLIPMIVAQAETVPCPQTVTPQHVIL